MGEWALSMREELEDGGCTYLASLFHLCLVAPNTGRKTLSPRRSLLPSHGLPTAHCAQHRSGYRLDVWSVRIAPCDFGCSGHAAKMSTGYDEAVQHSVPVDAEVTLDPCFMKDVCSSQ